MHLLKQSTAASIIVGPVLDSNGAAVSTAVIGDFNITKNGTTAAMASAATATHSHNGHYIIALTTGNTDTLGRLVVTVNNSAMAMPPVHYEILTAATFDALITNAAGTASGLPILNADNNIAADLQTIKTQAVTCAAGVTVLASVGTAATSTAQTGDSYAVVAHADYGNAKLVRSTTPANTLTVDAAHSVIAGSLPSPAPSGYGSTPVAAESVVIQTGTAQGAGTGSDEIQLATAASATDDVYVGTIIKIFSGTGVGQVRTITSYVGSTRTATVERAWTVDPSTDSEYSIMAFDSLGISATISGTVQLAASQPYYAPAVAGNAMVLTSDYDAAKTAAQAGNEMTLTAAYDAAKTAAQAGDEMTLTSAYDAAKTAATVGAAMTLTAAYDLAKTAAQAGDTMALTTAYDTAKALQRGTAQGPGTGGVQIQLASAASSADNFYNGVPVTIISGTGAGQTRTITSYVGSTRMANVDRAWTTAPSTDSVYALSAYDALGISATVSGSVTLAASQPYYAPAKVGSQMDLVNAPNATAITAIQAGLSTLNSAGVQTALTTQGYTTTRAVKLDNLDVAVSTRLSSATDPWAVALPGSYATGTAGKLLGTIAATLAGIASLANWLRALVRKDTPDTTALAEINATGGTFAVTTDSLEAIGSKTQIISSANGVTIISAVNNDTALNIYQGDQYESGRRTIQFTPSDSDVFPVTAETVVEMDIMDKTTKAIVLTLTATTVSESLIEFEPVATETALLTTLGSQSYQYRVRAIFETEEPLHLFAPGQCTAIW